MNKNLILIVVAVIVLFVIFKMMKMMKEQAEVMKSQTDVLMAVALKTGALHLEKDKKIAAPKKDAVVSTNTPESNDEASPKKSTVLTAAHKRLIKLFDDEIPKTSSQLRALYNKVATIQLDAKKFNSLLWNVRNNKGLITFEKLEDSDSVWGLKEWFEIDGDTAKLTDEYFNRISKA